MNCKETQELLHAYIDNELDVVHSIETVQHLKECAICSELFNSHQILRKSIAAGGLYYKQPAILQKRVMSALRQAEQDSGKVFVITAKSLGLVAALFALFLFCGWALKVILLRHSAEDLITNEVVSSHVRSLMGTHLTDVLSSDQHTVKPWFNGKLNFSPEVVDLTKNGFQLVGGRIDYIDNSTAVALVYKYRQHFINLLIWPAEGHSDTRIRAISQRGYNIFF